MVRPPFHLNDIFSRRGSIIFLVLAAAVAIIEIALYLYFSSRPLSGPVLSVPVPSASLAPIPLGSPEVSKLSGSLATLPASSDITVLLLGYGGGLHDGTYLTDSLIVINVKPDSKVVNIISIPRDLYASIPVDWDYSKDSKINAAYAIGVDDTNYPNKRPQFRGPGGGGNLAKYVVGQVIGIPVKYFVSVNFSKFVSGIDLLGGLEVNNPVAFEDDFYPVPGRENETCGFTEQQIADFKSKYSDFNLERQFTCRYEKLHFDKGPVKIDGATTLKYVRSRHSAQWGSDFARSIRQQAVLAAIKDKVFSLKILDKANPLFQKLIQSVRTDITPDAIGKYLTSADITSTYKVNNIYLTDQNVLVNGVGLGGAYVLLPKSGKGNFTGIQQFVKDNSK